MAKVIVASAQQQMRLFDSPDSYRKELGRFPHMARAERRRVDRLSGAGRCDGRQLSRSKGFA